MWAVLRFFVFVGVLVAAAVWLADNPGDVSLEWRGYVVETSVAVLLLAVVLVAGLTALIYRIWLFVRRVPSQIGEARSEGRRKRGFDALTKGMVAVAAGDVAEARRNAEKADALLSDQPAMSMLLSAQAAQLAGDEKAAERFFQAMAERNDTAFLGLRGLINQSLHKGDTEGALTLARRAYRLRPKTEWVATSFFDLLVRSQLWQDAEQTVTEMAKNGLLTQGKARHRSAVLGLEMAHAAEAEGDRATAIKKARKAHEADQDFIPAGLLLADLLQADGKTRKAVAVLETLWSRQPHPEVVDRFVAFQKPGDALKKVRLVENLSGLAPDHKESHVALAAAHLEAQLWGEARRHLELAAGDNPSAGVCRMRAELEEQEHGDTAAMRNWLMRATMADPDPAWVCDSCGNVTATYRSVCGRCDSFDSVVWKVPPHVTANMLAGPAEEGQATAVLAPPGTGA